MPRALIRLLASGGGLGLIPRAPGTWGTLPGVLILLATAGWHWLMLLGLTLAMSLAGVWICAQGARLGAEEDPGWVVWDEICGVLLTGCLIDRTHWLWILGAFLAFRLFDIWKPWPIGKLESVGGGTGIMLDDLGAGLMAGALLLGMQSIF